MPFVITKISPTQQETVAIEVETLEEAQIEILILRNKLSADWMAQIYEVADWKKAFKRSKKRK
jgi:hypothetical protein